MVNSTQERRAAGKEIEKARKKQLRKQAKKQKQQEKRLSFQAELRAQNAQRRRDLALPSGHGGDLEGGEASEPASVTAKPHGVRGAKIVTEDNGNLMQVVDTEKENEGSLQASGATNKKSLKLKRNIGGANEPADPEVQFVRTSGQQPPRKKGKQGEHIVSQETIAVDAKVKTEKKLPAKESKPVLIKRKVDQLAGGKKPSNSKVKIHADSESVRGQKLIHDNVVGVWESEAKKKRGGKKETAVTPVEVNSDDGENNIDAASDSSGEEGEGEEEETGNDPDDGDYEPYYEEPDKTAEEMGFDDEAENSGGGESGGEESDEEDSSASNKSLWSELMQRFVARPGMHEVVVEHLKDLTIHDEVVLFFPQMSLNDIAETLEFERLIQYSNLGNVNKTALSVAIKAIASVMATVPAERNVPQPPVSGNAASSKEDAMRLTLEEDLASLSKTILLKNGVWRFNSADSKQLECSKWSLVDVINFHRIYSVVLETRGLAKKLKFIKAFGAKDSVTEITWKKVQAWMEVISEAVENDRHTAKEYAAVILSKLAVGSKFKIMSAKGYKTYKVPASQYFFKG